MLFIIMAIENEISAYVKNAYRDGQEVHISTLEKFLDVPMDMFTIVIIGNSGTYKYGKYMITPRNYRNKYNL